MIRCINPQTPHDTMDKTCVAKVRHKQCLYLDILTRIAGLKAHHRALLSVCMSTDQPHDWRIIIP